MKFLLAGISVRALAWSAVRAGYRVSGVDYFGDRDLPPMARSRCLLRSGAPRYKAEALPALAAGMDYGALVYGANLENHPDVVDRLAAGRLVFGNSPEVLARVRHWPTLARVCAEEGISMPETLFAPLSARAVLPGQWLQKPVLSGGGHAIRSWDGSAPGPGWYAQRRMPGTSASAVFIANGEESAVLGISEQILGDEALGCSGFRHCGNILPLEAPGADGCQGLDQAVADMVSRLTRRLGLRGVCGADFLVAQDPDGRARPVLLEINPRITASAELMEEAFGVSVFEALVAAQAGQLPAVARPGGGAVWAKGVVFARTAGAVPRGDAWIRPNMRDIGHPGDAIAPGAPICSVIVQGPDRVSALKALHASARAIRRDTCGTGAHP